MHVNSLRIMSFVVCFLLYITCSGSQTNTDAEWVNLGGQIPGITGTSEVVVNALATGSTGMLYVGGDFNTAGGITTAINNIAQWNGSEWSPLGGGVQRTTSSNAEIFALVTDGSGNLYAGGRFEVAGEVPANNIAKWDGNTWSALDSGTGLIYSLALGPDGTLYVGGYSEIHKWDGDEWQTLPGYFDEKILDIICDKSGILYACGGFNTIDTIDTTTGYPLDDTVIVNGIAKWNGETWSPLGTGLSGALTSMAIDSSGNLYVSGSFDTAGFIYPNSIAMWNGTSWSSPGDGIPFTNDLVFDGNGILYAAGGRVATGDYSTTTIYRWDGTTWSELASRLRAGINDGYVNALAVDNRGNSMPAGNSRLQTTVPLIRLPDGMERVGARWVK